MMAVQMTQRSSRGVQAIVPAHDGAVQAAYVVCIACGKRAYTDRVDDDGIDDRTLTKDFKDQGWAYLGYGRWACPDDRREHEEKPRCRKCGRFLTGTGIFTSDSYYNTDEIMICGNPKHKEMQ